MYSTHNNDTQYFAEIWFAHYFQFDIAFVHFIWTNLSMRLIFLFLC